MQLAIFPERSFDHSLLTAVLIGLYVRLAFTEWLGWGFSGLVVPGYLAAVAVARPSSAVVVLGEAILTYVIVRALAWSLSRSGLGSQPFGRERFLWIVVISVGVRILVEGVMAPLVHAGLRGYLGFDVTAGHGFYGAGLVLVPLLANACWKPGLGRGLVQSLVTTGIAYLLLQGLMKTTNFSLANVTLSFERLALDFSASPKSYILLVITALVASRLNLRYGWDTSGVMIPALLCLGWFESRRVLSTLSETLLIVGATVAFLRLPRVHEWNVEGPRRIALIFTLGCAIKFVLVQQLAWTSVRATDVFGIGYLLPSLLAVKVWQRRNPAIVLVPAVQISMMGLVLGTAAGFGLVRFHGWLADLPPQAPSAGEACGPSAPLERELWLARARVAVTAPSDDAPRIDPYELQRLERLVRAMARQRAASSCDASGLAGEARALGLTLSAATARDGALYFVVTEAADTAATIRGFGTIAIPQRPATGPVLVATGGDDEPYAADVLAERATVLDARAVVVDGLRRSSRRGETSTDADTPVRVAAGALGGAAVILRIGAGPTRWSGEVGSKERAALETRLGAAIRDDGPRGWAAELQLSERDAARLGAGALPSIAGAPGRAAWLAEERSGPAQPLGPSAAALLAEHVVRPLAAASAIAGLSPSLRSAAAASGYVTETIAPGSSTLAIASQGGLHAGGGLVADLGGDPGLAIEVASEHRGAWELGDTLARQLRARMFVVAGTSAPAETFLAMARAVIALGARAPTYVRIVVDTTQPVGARLRARRDRVAGSGQRVEAALRDLGVPVVLEDPTIAPDAPGLAGAVLDRLATGPVLTLWIAPEVAERFRPATVRPSERALLQRLGIASETADLASELASACSAPSGARPERSIVEAARAYAEERAAGLLPALARALVRAAVRGTLAADVVRGSTHLVLTTPAGAVAVGLGNGTGEVAVPCTASARAEIARALDARARVIDVGGSR